MCMAMYVPRGSSRAKRTASRAADSVSRLPVPGPLNDYTHVLNPIHIISLYSHLSSWSVIIIFM